jgi:hypothetical protein
VELLEQSEKSVVKKSVVKKKEKNSVELRVLRGEKIIHGEKIRGE